MAFQTDIPTMISSGNGLDGALGGLLLGSLMRNDGFNNNRHGGYDGGYRNHGEGCLTPTNFTAGITGVTDTIQNTEVMAALGDIKQGVFQAEGNLQLAMAGSTGEIRSHLGAVENTLVQGQSGINQHISNSSMAINQNVSNAIASSLASQNNILSTVLTSAAAGISATKDAQYALATATRDDGDKTRALIESINLSNLNRELGVAQSALLEERSHGRSREIEINVSQSVAQNQTQINLQNQQQQQMQILANLAAGINNLAGDIQAVRQTQSNVNFGTQAGVGQTAQATNNRVS